MSIWQGPNIIAGVSESDLQKEDIVNTFDSNAPDAPASAALTHNLNERVSWHELKFTDKTTSDPKTVFENIYSQLPNGLSSGLIETSVYAYEFHCYKNEESYASVWISSYASTPNIKADFVFGTLFENTWNWEPILKGNRFPTSNKNVYVDATNGSDTTGDGTQSNPWATIQKAVDECPSVMVKGCSYNIYVADGTYTENVTIASKPNINLVFSDNEDGVVLNGCINATLNSRVGINNKLTINMPDGISRALGCTLKAFLYLGSTSNLKIVGTSNNTYGIYASDNGTINIYSNNLNKISNVNVALLSGANSNVYINGLEIDSTCNFGLYAYGGIISCTDSADKFIDNASTKYKTVNGGRILTGSQGWQLISSVTGANSVAIDSELYTEFLVTVHIGTRPKLNIIIDKNTLGASLSASGYRNAGSFWYTVVRATGTSILLTEAFDLSTDVIAATTMTVKGRRV